MTRSNRRGVLMRRKAGRSGCVVCVLVGMLGLGTQQVAAAPVFHRVDLPNRIRYPQLGGIEDVTGDGQLDLIVGGDTGLFVFPGEGSFEFPTWYRAADDHFYVWTVNTADLNKDGQPDLVTGGVVDLSQPSNTDVVRVFLGEKGGRFRRVFEVDDAALGQYTFHDPRVGDFNGDGNVDFVLAGSEIYTNTQGYPAWRGRLETYLGDGRGSFAGPIRSVLSSGSIMSTIYVGDLNGDQRADVVSFNADTQKPYVSLANGSGGFQTPLGLSAPPTPADKLADGFPPWAHDVVGGDVNGDGFPDLVVRFAYRSPDPEYKWGKPREFSSIYYGDGRGRFQAPVRLREPAEHRRTVIDQAIADVNGDGRGDILLTGRNHFSYESGLFYAYKATDVYLSLGGGSFNGPLLSEDSGGSFADAAQPQTRLRDMDGDGVLDLVTQGDGVQIAKGDGAGGFGRGDISGAFDYALGGAVATGDFNGDGQVDVAVANSGSYNVTVVLGDGAGGWSAATNYEVGEAETPLAIVAADLNGDGITDLATASHGEYGLGGFAGVSILNGDGAGHFALARDFIAGISVGLVAEDLDHDGHMDLVVTHNESRMIDVFFDIAGANRLVTIEDPQGPSEEGAAWAVATATADFDRNGFTDIVRSSVTGVIDIFLNVGDPGVRSVMRVDMGMPVYAVAAGDLNGDGNADLVTTVYDWTAKSGGVLVVLGDGKGGLGTPVPYSLGQNVIPDNVAIADFDGAGQRAVVSSTYLGLKIFPVDAAGRLAAPVSLSASSVRLRNVALVDVNQDGLVDVVQSESVFLNVTTCGNGRLDGAEECDDGNFVSCDGCSDTCRSEVGFQCGDGAVNTPCGEECDSGAANSDVEPDACRSECRMPRCGDGVRDAGEECDDGNTLNCDGCSFACTLDPPPVCGDGVENRRCGEQCDDGNRVNGDGCSDTCEPELIPGGGPASTDCVTEWIVANPNNAPRYDSSGRFSRKQTCRDNDPTCDFDGGVAGSCTFHLSLCVAVNDSQLPRCSPAALKSYAVLKPSPRQASASAAAARTRGQIDATVDAMAAQPFGTCSAPMEVTVPLGKQIVRTRATTVARKRDIDTLVFKCTP